MSAALRPGVAYGLAVFAVGFVLGTLRVLLIAPAVGEATAVALEVPVMLFASAAIAPRLVAWAGLPESLGARAAMGVVGFVVLMALEWALSLGLLGRTVEETLATYATAAGILGLAGQVGFGVVPLLQGAERR